MATRIGTFLGGLLAVAALVPAPAVASPARPLRVAAFGDSLLGEAQDPLRWFGGLRGATVAVEAPGGSALCDLLDAVGAAAADPAVDVVVVAFSGNNLTRCTADRASVGRHKEALGDAYANHAAKVMGRARAGARVLWVTAPASRGPNPDGDAVRTSIVAAVGAYPAAEVVDGGALISPGGRWSATQPCLPFEPCTGPIVRGVRHNPVRARDGAHFCPAASAATSGPCPVHSSGALRYALTILTATLRS